ncbi:RagB/SusD family nutrient uptake outer membrane protein [Dyadobacter psychrotolerans]|nr:RagB/SusD family nutrient uptake outer membrane protein [Dyadobacter psychrotolerans]
MIHRIYILLLSAILFVGCQSDLLDTQPYDNLGESQFWITEKHALMGVNAIYNNLTQDMVYGQYFMLDCLSPYAYGYDFFEAEMTSSTTPYSATYSGKWSQLYLGVQRANDALDRIPAMSSLSDAMKNRLIGEAKFLRALHYFNLMDFFGAVPIYETPVVYSEAMKPRNTVEEVSAFIKKDLTEAIELLPVSYASADFGRATKGAAIALRGKTALYIQDFENAENDFKTVMTMTYDLHPNYAELFKAKTENNKEIIFSIQNIATAGFGESMSFRLGTRATRGSCWTNGIPSPTLVDMYENIDGSPFNWDKVIPGFSSMTADQKSVLFSEKSNVEKAYQNRDPRLQTSVIVPWAEYVGASNVTYKLAWPFKSAASPTFHIQHNWNANAIYVWRKFVAVGDESLLREAGPIDFPVIRFADVLLMFAEARNRRIAAPDAEVFSAINKVRTRAGLPALQNTSAAAPTYSATKADMTKRIIQERAVELAAEGVSYSDVRRWKIAEQVNNGPILEFTGKTLKTRVFQPRDYLWPIPQSEIDQNKAIVQNVGWQ